MSAHKKPTAFLPLSQITRSHVNTAEAAFHLNRASQTMHAWACGSLKSPIQPLRVNGRLAWRTSDIRKILGE